MHKAAQPLCKWQFGNTSDCSFVILGEAYRMHSSRLAFPFLPPQYLLHFSESLRLPTHFCTYPGLWCSPGASSGAGISPPHMQLLAQHSQASLAPPEMPQTPGVTRTVTEHCDTGHFSDVWEAPWPPQQAPPKFEQLLAFIYIVSSINC